MMLPAQVRVVEVGSRDGFQNLPPIPTEIKCQSISGMIEAGIREMEKTSFVSSNGRCPGLDRLVLNDYRQVPNLRLIALGPNLQSAWAALESASKR